MSSEKSRERRRLPFSVQLTLWYAAFFLVTVVALAVFSYLLLARSIGDRNRQLVQTRAQEYRAWLEEGGIAVLEQRFYRDLAGRGEALFVRILGPGQKVLFFSAPRSFSGPDAPTLPAVRPEEVETWSEIGTHDGEHAWIVSTSDVGGALILQVGMSVTQTRRLLSQYRLLLWLGVLPTSLLGVLGGWWLVYYSLRPVRRLRETLERIIEHGDMSERVPLQARPGALGALGVLANRLLEANERLIAVMRDSLDAVAHDLRTPITRLRNSAEVALESTDEPERIREALSDCMEETEQVLERLDTLMDLAEARGGFLRLDLADVSVSELIESVAGLYDVVAEGREVTLDLDVAPGLRVRADRRRLEQAIANLVDNAIKYSPTGGHIDIRAREEGEEVHIAVIDRGAGIPPDELPRIWERLFRGATARQSRGLGLGLSVVRAVVEAHGGSVSVASTPGEGSTFTVRLPREGG